MARRRKPQDPTYALIEQMVEQSGLNATTQEEVMDFSKMFMKAFLERSLKGEMNHFLKEEAAVEERSQEPECQDFCVDVLFSPHYIEEHAHGAPTQTPRSHLCPH